MISKIKIIFIPLAVVCSIFLFSPNTFAEDPSTLEKLKNKSYLQGAYKCFRGTVLVGNDAVRNYPLSTQGEYISKVSDPQVPDKIEHFDTFRAIAPFTSSADSLSNKIYLPNGLTEESNAKDSDAATNCAHLLNGKDYLLEDKDGDGFTTSIYKRFGKKEPDPGSDDFESIMDQIGYTPDSSKDGANCFRIRYKYAIINAEGKGDLSGPDYYLANRYCMDVNDKGYVEKLVEEPETDTVKYPIVVGPKGEPSAFDLTSGSTDVSFVASGGTAGAYVIPYRSDRGPSDVKYYDGTESFYNAISDRGYYVWKLCWGGHLRR